MQEEVMATKALGDKIRGVICEIILLCCAVILGLYFIPTYVVQRTIIDGQSMENSYHNGDNVIVSKFSYRIDDPERFDVITFYPFGKEKDSFGKFIQVKLGLREKKKEDYYIKRVIGLPGETVQIRGANIYIDGEKLVENYGKEPIEDVGIAGSPVKLKDDEYFVLGDNRGNSTDSREIGPVKQETISGKVVYNFK